MSHDKLLALKKSNGRRAICRLCHERAPVAILRVEVRKIVPGGYGESYGSRQVSVCEDCAAEVYPALRKHLP